MSEPVAWLVLLKFGRLQTYLFQVSRLKAMIGANALLGEVIRGQLSEKTFKGSQNLPQLATDFLPKTGIPQDLLQHRRLFDLIEEDPLKDRDVDNPDWSYQNGVLARDGGHFCAVFLTEDEAKEFINAANRLIANRLPGILLTSTLSHLSPEEAGGLQEKRVRVHSPKFGESILDAPQFQVCQIACQGPAFDVRKEQEGNRKEDVPVSQSVDSKLERAQRFDQGETHDLLGLLRVALLEKFELPLESDVFPNDFEEVAPESGYLAVITADGNGMGKRSENWRDKLEKSEDLIQREYHGEEFFYSMRVTVRKALIDALGETFRLPAKQIREKGKGKFPFRLMMLGGDDLLLVCDAIYALPFVISYAHHLEQQKTLADGKPLHVGMGVSIVKRSFPFHRAHELAEELVSSAKRLYRQLPEAERASTVDWLAISEAWHDDVKEVRRRDSRIPFDSETLVLSEKPYPILIRDNADTSPTRRTLESLLTQAFHAQGGSKSQPLFQTDRSSKENLRTLSGFESEGTGDGQGRLARTQLMALAEEIPKGRRQANWAAQLLPKDVREHLNDILNNGDVWTEITTKNNGHSFFSTPLLDFLELYELELQRRTTWEGNS